MDQVITGTFASRQARLSSPDCIRILSWNIERGFKLPAIADFLRSFAADLILLQEVDLNVDRTQYRDIARELASSLSLNYVLARGFQELRRMRHGTPAYQCLATLSPWPLSCGRIIYFQRQSGFWKPRWYVPQIGVFQRRLGGRIALQVEAQIDDRKVRAYNLHLESKGKNDLRLEQLQQLLTDAKQHAVPSPVVIGGDFNLEADNERAVALLHGAGFRDAVQLPRVATTLGGLPFHRARSIDWIYISGAAVDSTGQTHSSVRASDHYPVSATLTSMR
jgi:endonuclease/exonuclease/phosphatase family metal-dependent hydrolase